MGQEFRRTARCGCLVVAMLAALMWPRAGKGQIPYVDDAEQRAKEHRGWLFDRKYDRLDEMGKALRKDRPRSHTGASLQYLFHVALTARDGGAKDARTALEDRIVLLRAWHEAQPSLTSTLVLAGAEVDAGFMARGSQYLHQVRPEQLAEFERRIDIAEELLSQAAELQKSEGTPDMLTAWLRMRVGHAKGHSRDRMDDLLKEALAIEPLCLPAINQMSIYLLPQWYGEPGDRVRLAERVAELTKNRTGEAGYALVAGEILEGYEQGEFANFGGVGYSWERTRQGYLDLLKEMPETVVHRCRFLRLARKAGDRAAGKELVAWLKGRWDSRVFSNRIDFERVRSWTRDDFRSGEEELVIEIGDHTVANVAFIGAGDRLVATEDREGIPLRSVETGEVVETLPAPDVEFPDTLAVSPDGHILMACRYHDGGSRVRLFDLESRQSALLGKIGTWATGVAIGRGGNYVAICGPGGVIRRWENHAPPLPYQWEKAHDGHDVRAIAFSPDGTKIASVGNRSVSLWDAATRESFRTWTIGTPWAFAVAWSPKGERIATTGHQNRVQLWDPETGKLEADLYGGNSAIRGLAFSPDGARLVIGTGSYSNPTVRGQVIVWDVATRKLLRIYSGHVLGILEVAVSPDGSRIASASEDGTVRLWTMPPTERADPK